MATVYHLLMATSSRLILHVTQQKSSQTGFMNMTVSSVNFSGLPSHQLWIQQTFERTEKRILAAWMCSWSICSNYVKQSCQHGSESQRNVSDILWNLCQEKDRSLFWEKKKGSLSISVVFQMKCSVCAHELCGGFMHQWPLKHSFHVDTCMVKLLFKSWVFMIYPVHRALHVWRLTVVIPYIIRIHGQILRSAHLSCRLENNIKHIPHNPLFYMFGLYCISANCLYISLFFFISFCMRVLDSVFHSIF